VRRAWRNSCPEPQDCAALKTLSTFAKRSPNLLSFCVTCIRTWAVRDWLSGRRILPGETQAYVHIVTGHSGEEWAAGQKNLIEMPVATGVPCSQAGTILGQPASLAVPPKAETVKPWGWNWPAARPGTGDCSLSGSAVEVPGNPRWP
jgi:hypothetical protein